MRVPERAGLGAGLLVLAALLPTTASAQPAAARQALRSGQYEDAARAFRRALVDEPGAVDALRGLAEALRRTGAYDEAAEVARAGGPATATELGLALQATGALAEAEAAFRSAVDARATDHLTARVSLAELLDRTGRREEARAHFDAFIDIYNQGGARSAEELVAVGRAVEWLGRFDPALFQDALRAYDEAADADAEWAEPRFRLGQLFLAKYQNPQAHAELDRALRIDPRHPGALLAKARALEFGGEAGAEERAREALDVNERFAEAHAFLAGLALTREGHTEARVHAEAALEANPSSLEGLTALAAVHYLAGEDTEFHRVRRRALDLNPSFAELDVTVARLAEQTRRYAQAVERARAAAALDSTEWTAWGLLGMNQLRTGAIGEGRSHLERAFAGDPYNPWFKNNLDLLDTFHRFETVETEHFRLFLHGSEAELLAPLVAAFAEEAWDSLVARYRVEPPTPVRVEFFPSHADFSVRTMGEVGLGALGVAFGSVLVMDSPAARERGEYNWASTLWHELAHAFHLGMTDHRVPRWFSEGLAVHEQRRGREGWGHQPSFAFLDALQSGRLKRVSELDDGFMRPDYPQQVLFSYYQASLVFQLLEDRWGFGAVRRMLEGYREGATTDEVVRRVLQMEPEAFDDLFTEWLRERFAAPLRGVADLGDAPPPQAGLAALEEHVRRHPGDLVSRLRLGGLLTERARYADARPHLDAVVRAFPEYGGPDSPYRYLARIHLATGDTVRAQAALARLNALNESNYGALVEEAHLARALGRTEREAWALDRALQVFPYDVEVHQRLAVLRGEMGDLDGAVAARAAVVALGPVDRAEALYRLARAQQAAGDVAAARSTVLQALEVAPNFEAALDLLLELRAQSRPVPGGRH